MWEEKALTFFKLREANALMNSLLSASTGFALLTITSLIQSGENLCVKVNIFRPDKASMP